jgi:hypothetical protein
MMLHFQEGDRFSYGFVVISKEAALRIYIWREAGRGTVSPRRKGTIDQPFVEMLEDRTPSVGLLNSGPS